MRHRDLHRVVTGRDRCMREAVALGAEDDGELWLSHERLVLNGDGIVRQRHRRRAEAERAQTRDPPLRPIARRIADVCPRHLKHRPHADADRAAAERDLIRDGGDLTILTYGTTVNAALDAAALLAAQQVDAAVLKLRMLKPLVLDEVLASVRKTGRLLVVEEQNAPGSIYEAVVSQMAAQRIDPVVRALNLGDHYTTHGAVAALRHGAGIDAGAIAAAAMEVTRIAT